MPEKAFKGTVLEGRERRYTIVNEADLLKYVPGRVVDKLRVAHNQACDFIEYGRKKDGKQPYNSYIVINTDEPYVKEIIEVMKKHGHWEEEITNPKVFLGGTCNGSTWREDLIPLLKVDYFNPVVEEWTTDCMAREIKEREECDFCLYVITPLMKGVYSIAEAVEDSIKRPEKTLFCVLDNEYGNGKHTVFEGHELKSLEQTKQMIQKNGALCFNTLGEVAAFLNQFKK